MKKSIRTICEDVEINNFNAIHHKLPCRQFQRDTPCPGSCWKVAPWGGGLPSYSPITACRLVMLAYGWVELRPSGGHARLATGSSHQSTIMLHQLTISPFSIGSRIWTTESHNYEVLAHYQQHDHHTTFVANRQEPNHYTHLSSSEPRCDFYPALLHIPNDPK